MCSFHTLSPKFLVSGKKSPKSLAWRGILNMKSFKFFHPVNTPIRQFYRWFTPVTKLVGEEVVKIHRPRKRRKMKS